MNVPGALFAFRQALHKKLSVLVMVLFILGPLFGVITVAHAFSFSDFFAPIFNPISALADSRTYSAALTGNKTPALKAAINVDPNPAKGGGDITIVGGVALLPESGPEGTLADIQVEKHKSTQISIYVVREGDSLSAIAGMFDVSVNTILWANNLTSARSVHPGDTLVILPITGIEYTVKKGDTLASVVKKHKADMQEVLDFNNLTQDSALSIGDTIVIPDGVDSTVVATTATAKTTKAPILGSGGPVIEGYYLRPLIGGRKSQGIHGYNGVDISTPIGTPVMASCPGNVMVSRDTGWNGGYGDYVVIQCSNGTQTVYGHLSATNVSAGSSVVRGQVIGLSGNTGRSTGAHLHFEIRGASNPF